MTFKTNLPVMVFIDFKICLPTKKKIKPNIPPKQPKHIVYAIKTAHLNLKHIVQANLNLKIYIVRVIKSEYTSEAEVLL